MVNQGKKMSAIALPQKHLFLKSSQDIRLFCACLLEQYRINIFVHVRYYRDGTCFILSSNDDWLQYHLYKGYLVPAPIPAYLLQQRESFHIIPGDGPFAEAKYDLMQRYQSDKAVDYIVKGINYIDVFCFSFWADDKNALNVIVNNLNQFKQFVSSFKDEMAVLLKDSEKYKIDLPTEMRGIHFSAMTDNESKNIKKFGITQRQLEILYWSTRGKTAKEIAVRLNVSRRTVESHLAGLKLKMNVLSKSELIEKANAFL